MAIARVAGTIAMNTNTSPSVAIPTGTLQNHVILAGIVTWRNGGTAPTMNTVPSGWNLLSGFPVQHGGNFGTAWGYWKLATGSDATPTWVLSSSQDWGIVLDTYSGTSIANPVAEASGVSAATSASTVAAPARNATAIGQLLYVFGGGSVVSSATHQSGMTERQETTRSGIWAECITCSDKTLSATGTTGTQTITWNGASQSMAGSVLLNELVVQRLAPDAILSRQNLTGLVSTIQDDPDAPDANWLTAP
jgi:hypothetical protein